MLHSRYLQVVLLTVLLIAAAGLPAFGQFETRGSVAVSTTPYSIAIGDFNRDGRMDIAVLAFSSGQVAVSLGNGDGTFRKPTYYSAVASSLAAADLRNNGILDLVLTDNLSDNLQVMLGNGDGTFSASSFYPTPDFPNVIGVGDFNGDHNLDLVTVDQSGICPCISVLLGNGDGTFQEPPINTMPPDPAAAIGTGDFNHDGKLDLITVGQFGSASEAGVLLGNGDGTFTPGMTYVVGSDPQSVVVADFNGDHQLDLAVADALGGSIDILLGNGDATFTQGAVLPGSFPVGVRKADFNGDGKVDLVVVTGVKSTVVSVYLGNGDGTFQAAMNFPAGNGSAPFVGDFNGDHQTDLVLTSFLSNAVLTLLNTGTVSFSPTTPLNFHKQTVGTTSVPQTIKLTNTGKKALAISSMTLKGPFDMSSTCGRHVAPGAKCAIRVTFSPKTLGATSGTISIIDSASSQPQVIVLSGTGS
jgi:hypothetical protein